MKLEKKIGNRWCALYGYDFVPFSRIAEDQGCPLSTLLNRANRGQSIYPIFDEPISDQYLKGFLQTHHPWLLKKRKRSLCGYWCFRDGVWITASQLAEVTGISLKAAHKRMWYAAIKSDYPYSRLFLPGARPGIRKKPVNDRLLEVPEDACFLKRTLRLPNV
jgi:hypothetical protein